jgi:hypothetical protein
MAAFIGVVSIALVQITALTPQLHPFPHFNLGGFDRTQVEEKKTSQSLAFLTTQYHVHRAIHSSA